MSSIDILRIITTFSILKNGFSSSGLNTVDAYMESTMDEMKQASVGTYDPAKHVLSAQLENLSSRAFMVLDDETQASDYLTHLINASPTILTVNQSLAAAQSLITNLNTGNFELIIKLPRYQESIEDGLANCTDDPLCDAIRNELPNLTVSADYSSMSFTAELEGLKAAYRDRYDVQFQNALILYYDIARTIDASLEPGVESVQAELDTVSTEMKSAVS